MQQKKIGIIIAAVGIIVCTYSFGYRAGNMASYVPTESRDLTNTSSGTTTPADFGLFWKAWAILSQKQVNATKVSDQTKVYGAIQGLASSFGDPYTVFFPPVEAKNFADQIAGNFEGVGMEVGSKGGTLTVISPLKNTPASRAGIQAGDILLEINGTTTENMSVDDAISMIRGPKGTTVTFKLYRASSKQPFIVKVVRDVIDIPTIDTETKNGVFVIHFYSFTANSPDLFRAALRTFIASDNDKLVLDLRGNPGGYLEAAVDIASWFLPTGNVIVKEEFGDGTPENLYRSRGYNIFNKNLKFVILADKGSASAAEILAGALKEYGVAKLVGTNTFGKGSVQELVPITSNTSLKVTVAKWLTPNGVSISDGGLTPDVHVDAPTDAELTKNPGTDPQFNKAVEILNSWK